jgi:hypothetical protein
MLAAGANRSVLGGGTLRMVHAKVGRLCLKIFIAHNPPGTWRKYASLFTCT